MKAWQFLLTAAFILAVVQSLQASALSSYKAEYVISNSNVFANVSLTSADLYNFSYNVPADASSIKCSINCTVKKMGSESIVTLRGHDSAASISFESSSFLDNAKSHYFLLDFSGVKSSEKSISVTLPKYSTLSYPFGDSSHTSIVPRTNDVTTDGVRMTIVWDNKSLSQNDALMVIYKESGSSHNYLAAIIILLILSISALSYFFIFRKPHSRPKASTVIKNEAQDDNHNAIYSEDDAKINSESQNKKDDDDNDESSKTISDITLNLYEDEKSIVRTLQSLRGEAWQKELQIKTGLSKVKLSRRLRALEEKGVVEKVPYGNTNRIRLAKSSKKGSENNSDNT